MKRAWIALVALAVLALPATALAHKGPRPEVKNAAKYCKSLRTKMGAEAFRQTYGGTSNAFGKCVSKRVHELRQARKAAMRSCAKKHGRKAFKRCVAKKTKEATGTDNEAFLAAVRTCLAEHDADPEMFNEDYSDDNGSTREAFGNCVRQQLEQGSDDETDPGDEEGTDPDPGDEGDPQAEPSQDDPVEEAP